MEAQANAEDEDEVESLNIKELETNFASEDYLGKNIRVRPTSSYSGVGKEQSDAGHRHGDLGGKLNEDDDDRKFNTETLYDLTQ